MRRACLLVVAVVVALIPVHVGSAAAADRDWVGPFQGTRYTLFGGGPGGLSKNELHATIQFGTYQKNVAAVATYQCDGDFITRLLDCTRMPATGDKNAWTYPKALRSYSLAFADAALYRASFTDGHVLRCYGVPGPPRGLPEDQSGSWDEYGTCTVL